MDRGDPKPDEAARAKLRGQALGWLRTELDTWSKALDSDDPKARDVVAATLRHWERDPDLASVRDQAGLNLLPEAERGDWKALWNAVDCLIAKCGAAP
jgi:hypothetical protein